MGQQTLRLMSILTSSPEPSYIKLKMQFFLQWTLCVLPILPLGPLECAPDGVTVHLESLADQVLNSTYL